MASNIYVKSLFWLLSLGGIGYSLMILTQPSEEKITKIKAAGVNLTEDERKKVLFLKKLKEAANLKEPVNVEKSDN